MEALETRIGYHFENKKLLQEALTHPSLAYESRQFSFDNQRLEYLGDAVIQLILTDMLFRRFEKFGEGKLTKMRSRLVSREALCRFAEKIELGQHLLLGKGEAINGGRKRPSNLADAFEALAGAIYIDGGMEPSQKFLFENFDDLIELVAQQPHENNPKGELQEQLQAISPKSPTYHILSQEGPDHEKSFVAEVSWEGQALGSGSGASKKEAEIAAAIVALKNAAWEPKEVVNKLGKEQNNCEEE